MSSRARPGSGAVPGVLRRVALLVATLLAVALWAPSAAAYPWMIRHGFAKCASCHEDPMGGETLTGFGRVMSDTTLSTRWDHSTNPTKNAELFFGVEEPRWLRLGSGLRMMTALYKFPKDGQKGEFTAFPMQVDVFGQVRVGKLRASASLGGSRVPVGSPHAQAAQVTSNTSGDRPWNLLSRSHWLGYDASDSVLIRAGRMNLPFGMRIPEHVMWAREATRTDRESDQQHGVAVSYSGGRWRGELMGIAGNYQVAPDRYRERGYSLYGEYLLGERAALGVSSLLTHAKEDRLYRGGDPNTRQAHGVTARLSPIAPLAVLVEADVLMSSLTKPGYVGLIQGDYEFIQGLHGLLTGEIQDTGKPNGAAQGLPGAGKPQLGGWVSVGWFFFTHLDMRADLVVRQEAPVTFLSQLHYFF